MANTAEDNVAKKIEDMRAKEEAEKRLNAEQQMNAEMVNFRRRDQSNGYNVVGVDTSNVSDKEMAVQELINAQQKLCIDYSDAAKVDVNYTDFGAPGSREREANLVNRLKSHNDAYTLSMITSCYGPLSEGIDVKSVATTLFTHKLVNVMNPDFQMDKSRLYSNIASSMRSSLDGHPLAKKMAGPIINALSEAGVEGANDALSKRLQDNTLDDIVMTPRQIAALKLNFMEQYYVDTRSIDPSSSDYQDQMSVFTDNYNKALEHLGAIANNSGYEMSAVADEERYLVGLKSKQDPSKHYDSMFVETEPPYGAQPNQNGDIWQGSYMTADGHAWTSEDKTGAFTVRSRYTTESLPQLREDLARKGQQYAWMQQYLDSPDCPASKSAREQAKEAISHQFDEYREFVSVQLQDDLGYSDSYAKQLFDDSFGKAASAEKKISKTHVFDQSDVFSLHSKSDPGMDFYRELRYVTEKEAIRDRAGIDISAGRTANPTPKQQSEEDANDKSYRPKTDLDIRREALAKLAGNNSHVDIDDVGRSVSNSYIKDMDGDQLAKLMLHVGCNMEQGWQHNITLVNGQVQSTYSRHLEPSSAEGEEFRVQRRVIDSSGASPDTGAPSNRPDFGFDPVDPSPDNSGPDLG